MLRGSRRLNVRERARTWMKDGYLRFCLVTEAGLVSHPQSDVSASFPRSSMFPCRSDMIKVSGHRRQILLKEENHGVGVFLFFLFFISLLRFVTSARLVYSTSGWKELIRPN